MTLMTMVHSGLARLPASLHLEVMCSLTSEGALAMMRESFHKHVVVNSNLPDLGSNSRQILLALAPLLS